METAVETREINSNYPLEFLERGGDKLNANWPIERSIKFIKICQKRYPESEIIIRTNQAKEKLHIGLSKPDPLYFLHFPLDDWPKPVILITNHYETEEFKSGRKTLCPTEYLMTITVDTETLVQGNPPIKKIEFSALLSRGKTKTIIKNELGKIPNNWQFNPLPRR